MGWPIYVHHTKEVSVANKETMTINGIAWIWLRVGKRQIKAEILVSPDFEGLILGYDWLHRQGSFEWDFPRERIRLGRGNWVNMQDDEPLVKVRRFWQPATSLSPPGAKLLRTPTCCTTPGAACRNHRNTASWKVNPLRPWNTYIADQSYCP